MSLANAFSVLSIGDIILAGDYSYVVCREVHRNDIAKSTRRYAVASICKCNTHIERVLADSYAWNDKDNAFTDIQGTPISGWTADATVERGSYIKSDLKDSAFTMTKEDRPVGWSSPSKISLKLSIGKALNGAKYAETEEMFMLSMLKALGIETTNDQALALAKIIEKIGDNRVGHELTTFMSTLIRYPDLLS